MPAVQTEPLTCPACNKTGTRSGQGVSRFRHQETREPFGKCHHCNHSWPLEPQKGRVKTPFPYPLREWARKRGIITEGLDSAPVKSAAWVKNDGSISPSMTGLVFEYGDGVSHWISINKLEDPDRAGKMKYVQKWTPKNASLTLKQLWTWQNVELENPDPETAYLCEGEKDALTLGQAGFLAFAVPGAQSLREDRAKWLADRLKAENITRLRICFDFDQGGKSGTALSLSRLAQNYSLKIEVLKWPEGTKDGADVGDLARTFGAGFGRTLLGMEWVNPWADPSAEIVEQVEPEESGKDRLIHIHGNLYRLGNSAYVERNSDDDNNFERSNFVIDILRREILPDDTIQYLIRKQTQSGAAKPTYIPASAFATPGEFHKCCADFGSFHCTLEKWQLWRISDFETSKPSVQDVIRIGSFGWNPKLKAFIFPNGMIQNGTFYGLDPETRLITTDTGSYHVNLGDENQILGGKFPQFSVEDFAIQSEESAARVACEVVENTAHIIGGESDQQGTLVLSWFLSSLYSDTLFDFDIITDFQAAFPFLMFVGDKGTGKTETMSRFLQLFGFRKLSSGDSYKDTTSNYFGKVMSFLSNVPFWLEEIENQSGRISMGTLKAAYNRGTIGRGTQKGTMSYAQTATLCLCGEEPLSELITRSIVLMFPHKSERTQKNVESFQWMGRNADKLRALFAWMMTERTRNPTTSVRRYLESVSHFDSFLSASTIADERTRQNYSISLGGLGILPNGSPQHIETLKTSPQKSPFWHWFREHISHTASVVSRSNPISEGLAYFLSDPANIPFFRYSKQKKPVIYLPVGSLGNLKRIPGFPYDRFHTALITAPYCLSSDCSPKIPKAQFPNWETDREGKTVKSIALDALHTLIPSDLLDNAYGWSEYVGKWVPGLLSEDREEEESENF